MKESKGKTQNFEEDLKKLEMIINQLEDGGLSLDDSLRLFEEGQILLKKCREKLNEAQVKVNKLMADGSLQEINPEQLGR